MALRGVVEGTTRSPKHNHNSAFGFAVSATDREKEGARVLRLRAIGLI